MIIVKDSDNKMARIAMYDNYMDRIDISYDIIDYVSYDSENECYILDHELKYLEEYLNDWEKGKTDADREYLFDADDEEKERYMKSIENRSTWFEIIK